MSDYGSLVVSVTEPTTLLPLDGYWLRLEVRQPDDDKIVASDGADLVDELYDIDPCVEPDPLAADKEPVTEGDLFAAAQKVLFDAGECARLQSGNYDVQVEAVRSHLQYPYRLRLSVGTIGVTEVQDEIKEEAFDIDGASSLTLPYPIYPIDRIQASWLGAVCDKIGRIIPPPIRCVGNTLFWGFEVTGTIKAHWQTKYDLVTLHIPGIPDAGGGLGQQQRATLTGFYIGPAAIANIEPPERDESIDAGLLAQICGHDALPDGGGRSIDDDEEPPPEEEEEEEEDTCESYAIAPIASEDFYEQTCCAPPTRELDGCGEWWVRKPIEPIKDSVRDYYQSFAGQTYNDTGFLVEIDKVEFVPIGPNPSDSDGCGFNIYSLEITNRACCDVWTPIIIDTDKTPDVLPAGGNVTLYWTGGLAPFTIHTSSAGTWLHGGFSEVVTSGWWCKVYAGPTFCGTTVITIRDACGDTSWVLRSTLGKWQQFVPVDRFCLGGDSYTPLPGANTITVINAAQKHKEDVGCATGSTTTTRFRIPHSPDFFPRGTLTQEIADAWCQQEAPSWCATRPLHTSYSDNHIAYPCYADPDCWYNYAIIGSDWRGDQGFCVMYNCGVVWQGDVYWRWVC